MNPTDNVIKTNTVKHIFCSPIDDAGQPHGVPEVDLDPLRHGDKAWRSHDLHLGLLGLHRVLVILVTQVILVLMSDDGM